MIPTSYFGLGIRRRSILSFRQEICVHAGSSVARPGQAKGDLGELLENYFGKLAGKLARDHIICRFRSACRRGRSVLLTLIISRTRKFEFLVSFLVRLHYGIYAFMCRFMCLAKSNLHQVMYLTCQLARCQTRSSSLGLRQLLHLIALLASLPQRLPQGDCSLPLPHALGTGLLIHWPPGPLRRWPQGAAMRL